MVPTTSARFLAKQFVRSKSNGPTGAGGSPSFYSPRELCTYSRVNVCSAPFIFYYMGFDQWPPLGYSASSRFGF